MNSEHSLDCLVFDIEANGLYEDATTIHCICGKYLDQEGIFSKFSLYSDHLTADYITKCFSGKKIIGHNIINYDIPMIKKFYGVDLIELVGIENIVDTYILSQLLYPDIQPLLSNATIRTYPFTLELLSPLGNDFATYSITVINQNTPSSQGNPNPQPPNSRIPVLYNTRPPTYNINDSDPYYGYYILPPVAPTQSANMGKYQSGEYFAFKMIGHGFDGNPIKYSFSDLPNGLTGDVNTGWITGTPSLSTSGLSNYNFRVGVYKADAPQYASPFYNFNFTLQKNITGNITWITDSNLGQLLNGTVSTLFVRATSDIELNYSLVSDSLPPKPPIVTGKQIGRAHV